MSKATNLLERTGKMDMIDGGSGNQYFMQTSVAAC